MSTEAIDSKFDAGKGAGDIFQQIMSGMEAQVRADLTKKLTAFAASLKPMTHNKFRKKFTNAADRHNANKLMYRVEMPDPLTKENKKANKKILDVAEREERKHEIEHDCRYSSPVKCAKRERLRNRWHRLYTQQNKIMNAYHERKHLPLTGSKMAEAVTSLVEDSVKELFQSFIAKQTHKIDEIISGRAGHVTGNVQPSLWESTLFFVLADGTRFEMRMKIVQKISCCGNPFWQFPTTFHNAYDAKGEKVWSSEENLKDTLGVVE